MEQPLITFDQLLENKIRMGKFQYICLFTLSILEFIEGYEGKLGGTLIAILRSEWDLSNQEVIVLGSIYYLGRFFGALFQSFFTDIIGRKPMLQLTSGMMFFTLLMTAFSTSFYHILMLRFIYGFLQGSVLTLCLLYTVEIVPQQIRGKTSVILQSVQFVGKVYFILTSFIFMRSYSEDSWRYVLISYSAPALLCFILSIYYIDESARYLIAIGDINSGIVIMQKMGLTNHGKKWEEFSSNEIEGLILWQMEQFHGDHLGKNREFLNILKDEMLPITLRLWVINSCYIFFQTSLYLLSPFLLAKHSNIKLLYDSFILLADFPAIVFSYMLIDRPDVGRKKVVQVGSFAMCCIHFIMFLGGDDTLIFGLMLSGFNSRIVQFVLKTLIAESYTTIYRVYGMGSATLMGQLAAAIGPIIIWPAFSLNDYFPMLICSLLFLIIFGLVSLHPIDLTNKALDQPEMNLTLIKRADSDSYWNSIRSSFSNRRLSEIVEEVNEEN